MKTFFFTIISFTFIAFTSCEKSSIDNDVLEISISKTDKDDNGSIGNTEGSDDDEDHN